MSEVKKIEDTDLQKLNQIQSKYAEISAKLGQLKIEQLLVNQQSERLKQLEDSFINDYLTLQKEETEFASDITKKYGTGEINIETGEFIPSV